MPCRDDAIVCLRKRALPRLDDVKQVVKKPWQYYALCPAHKDHKRSLSVTTGKFAHILYQCHAGCDEAAVHASLVNLGIPVGCLAKPKARDAAEPRASSGGPDPLRSALLSILYGPGTPAERLALIAIETEGRMPAGHDEVDALAARVRLSRPLVYRATSGPRRGRVG